MNIEPIKYNLPDLALLEDENWEDYKFYTWIPDKTYLILGLSNKVEKSLILETVLADKVEVFKRPSGGETVILTPNTLVLSTTVSTEGFMDPQIFFKNINNVIIEKLTTLGIKDVQYRGISDVCIGNKKILGSSIYRRKNKLFYHAVLNVSESIDTISKYIAHPPREPEYRKGRNHKEFVTSIKEAGYIFNIEEIKQFFS